MYLHTSKHKCLALMLLLLTCFALPSLAAEYYVSSSGSDTTGNGTSANPWYSVDKPDADRILLPGDTVYISGYYSLAPEVDCLFRIRYCSGVTYKATPGSTAVFDGDSSSVAGKTIAAITANGTTLDGLRFQFFNDGVAIAAAGVTVRGCVFLTSVSATGRCIIAGASNGLLVANNTFARDDYGTGGYGLWITGGCSNVRFVNNIADGVAVRIRNDDPKSALTHSNNLYSAFSLFEGNVALGAAEFEADPSYIDFDSLALNSNSPAICAGVVIPGYSPAGRDPDLGAVQLTSPAATSWLQGQVKVHLAADDNPAPGARIQLDGSTTSVTVYAQADGSYKVPLPPDNYSVTVTREACADLYTSVNVSPVGTYNQDFTLDLDHPVTKYYVSVNDGDDSYDGLAKTYEGGTHGPWKTIGRAKAQWDPATWDVNNPLANITWQLQPGDAVIFQPGTYPGCVNYATDGIWAWGTEFAPITFKAEPGAVIDGAGSGAMFGFYVAWGTFPVEQYSADTEPCRNIVIDGFEIKNVYMAVRQVISYGLTVKNCTIHDLNFVAGGASAGVNCHWSPSGPTVLNNTFYNIPAADPSLAGFNSAAVFSEGMGRGVVIEGNVAHDMGGSLYHLLGVSWPNYDTAFMANNTVVNCLSALSIYHSHPTIDPHNMDFVNNVVVGSTVAAVINSWSTTTDLPPGLVQISSSHNVFYNNAQDLVLTSPGPFDFFGVDPKLDSGYKLLSGSPAIDTGTDVGLPYQGSAPDRGAFESSFTGSTVLSGRVTYTDGVVAIPAIGATVTCNDMVTAVAADGGYMLPLPAGTHSVTAEYNGATLTDTSVVAPGTKDFSFAVITGSVALSDGVTMTPAASAKVSIDSLGVSTIADANGVYTLMVPAGSYTVTARSPLATASQSATATAPGVQHLVLPMRDLTAGPFTYYVKTDGDDYSDGLTPATAWATIDNGDSFGIVQPGDTVQVMAGTYTYYRAWSAYGFPTSIGLTRSGTPEAPITYQAEPGVVVDGQGVSNYGVWVAGASNTKIIGFEFTNSLYGTVTQGVGASNITFENCVSRDCIAEGNIVLATANVSFIRCIVYGCGGTSCFDLREQISGVNITNCVGVGSNRGVTLYGNAGTGVVIRNSIFMNNAQYGIRDPYETGNIDSDYNTIWGTTPYYGVTPGANDQIANPLFVDAAGHDYHLTQYSPCINTGVDVGLPYNLPAPDRGAFETDYTDVPSTLTGLVTVDSLPAAYAKVVDDLGVVAYADANGYYTLWTISGTRTVTASHALANSATATVTVPGTHDFSLTTRTTARTFYVKPGGNDTFTGMSDEEAWASIDNGDGRGWILPGDTIIVKPGVYNSVRTITRPDGAALTANVQLTRSGAPGAPITYKAEPGAVLDGVNPASTTFNIDTMGVSYLVIDGFEYMNSSFGMDLETNWSGFATGNVVSVKDVTIRNCVGHDLALIGIVLFGIDNFVCENNVIYNIAASTEGGFELAFGGYGVIRNCTVYGAGAATHGVILYSYAGENGATTQVTVQNCIFSGLTSGAFYDMTGVGVTEDYNCIFNCGATTSGAHDIFTDPMFVNAAANDYHLAAGSPCIDAGINVGLPYNGTAPDMGAYEVTEAPPVEVATLREALGQPVGTNVKITNAQVATVATGVFADGRYYVEDADRTVGIMVIPASGLPAIAEGDRVMLTGVISVDANGEKYIAATAQTPTSGATLGTLGMGGKALAGNGGLLVRVWGEVKTKTATAATIDDGSGVVVTIVLDGLVTPLDTTNIVVGKHISVSGPAGLTSDGAPTVRPRAIADVKVYD